MRINRDLKQNQFPVFKYNYRVCFQYPWKSLKAGYAEPLVWNPVNFFVCEHLFVGEKRPRRAQPEQTLMHIYRPRREKIIDLVASVRPFVCLSVLSRLNRSHYQSSGVRLCVCDQWAYAGNCADAVDRLLIIMAGAGGIPLPGPKPVCPGVCPFLKNRLSFLDML